MLVYEGVYVLCCAATLGLPAELCVRERERERESLMYGTFGSTRKKLTSVQLERILDALSSGTNPRSKLADGRNPRTILLYACTRIQILICIVCVCASAKNFTDLTSAHTHLHAQTTTRITSEPQPA